MALLLNIETATEVCSVCVSEDTRLLSLKESAEPMVHSQQLTLLIQACIEEVALQLSDMSAVAVSSGPGSYTALRVGSSVAKGISYALDIPMVAVPTLKALAVASSKEYEGAYYAPMIDARRQEVYTTIYNNVLSVSKPCQSVILNDQFLVDLIENSPIVCSGNGCEKFQAMTPHPSFIFTKVRCSAAHLIPLSVERFQKREFESIAYFEPTYLKPPNITVSKKRL